MNDKSKTILQDWSKKMAQPVEELTKEFNKYFDANKAGHPDIADEELERLSLSALQIDYKRQFLSKAETFVGIVIGVGDKRDFSKKQRETALAKYKENPEQAAEDGYVDETGQPLYTSGLESKIGKPIPPEGDWSRGMFMICANVNDKKIKLAKIGLKDKLLDLSFNMFKQAYTFRANVNKNSSDDMLILNQASVTSFKELDDKGFVDAAITTLKTKTISLNKLSAWHDKNQTNFDRLVITKGIVSNVFVSQKEGVSSNISIDDLDYGLMNNNEIIPPITCWLSKGIEPEVVENSEVYVIGATSITKEQQIMMNAYGIYSVFDFVKPEKINSEDLNTKEAW